MASPDAASTRTAASSHSPSDNITLRIVTLAHGNRAEDDLYLVLGLDTTIGQLKQRVEESLSQHPAPELQRLIYQGRALLDANASLRQILRLDTRAASSSHVLHLVIRDGTIPLSQPTASVALQGGAQPALPSLNPPPLAGPAPAQMPQASPPFDHMRIHNQLHNIQHQLHHTQALNRANLARLQAQQVLLQSRHPPANHDVNSSSPRPQNQVPPVVPILQPQPQHGHAPPGPAQPNLNITRVEERIGPNGEHIRTTTTNNGTSSMTFRITGLNVPNPTDRPSSAPGSSPTAFSDPTTRNAHQPPPNIQVLPQPPPMPAGFPFPPAMQLPLPFPNILPPLFNTLNPLNAAATHPASSEPLVWLLSSPNGPQGILLAPDHGLFISPQQAAAAPAQQAPTHLQPTPTTTDATAQPAATPTTDQPPGSLVVRQLRTGPGQPGNHPNPPPPQPGARPQPDPGAPRHQVQPRANRNEENEILQFIINRGWLFLRLYMFVFVLSESGTWRRIIMLTLAIIFCLLPRNNPLTDLLRAARRHFENLIGPPAIPDRQQQTPGNQGQNADRGQHNRHGEQRQIPQTQPPTGGNNTRGRHQAMPTPEEAARRLLEQQNRRNPNPILNAIQSIEQALVLFLASLVPGLGERHVQAREQARRILEEEERRQQEQRERAESLPQPDPREGASNDSAARDDKDSSPLPQAWSTSTTDADGGARASGSSTHTANDQEHVRLRHTGT